MCRCWRLNIHVHTTCTHTRYSQSWALVWDFGSFEGGNVITRQWPHHPALAPWFTHHHNITDFLSNEVPQRRSFQPFCCASLSHTHAAPQSHTQMIKLDINGKFALKCGSCHPHPVGLPHTFSPLRQSLLFLFLAPFALFFPLSAFELFRGWAEFFWIVQRLLLRWRQMKATCWFHSYSLWASSRSLLTTDFHLAL